jgi:hypothetical protein
MRPAHAPATPLRSALLLLAALGLGPAVAGTLYRCVGADGVSHYGSKRLPGMQCSVAAQYRPDPRPAIPRPTPPEAARLPTTAGSPAAAPATPTASMAAPGRRVEFLSVPGEGPAPAGAAVKGARVTRGAVYTYVKDGVTHYTNVRPQNAGAPVRTLFTYVETCYACAPLPGVDFGAVRLNTTAYAAEVRDAAQRHGVDEALVRAVMHAESAFNPHALSHKGAQGLMQLIPATARRFGVADPFDPAQNIQGGVQYLRWLLDRYDNNTTLAAAGYNAGEGNVDRHGGVPPFQETQLYVSRVATLHARYREALAGAAAPASGNSGASAP